jgi:hypothetical protein
MKNKYFRLLFFLMLSGVPLVLPSPAHAYICAQPSSTLEAISDAETVFVGKVIAIEEGQFERRSDISSAVFDVAKVFKGEVGLKAIVSADSADCNASFEQGQSYIVFARKFEHTGFHPNMYGTNDTPYGERLFASECSGTEPLASDRGEQTLKDLGPGKPPAANLSGNGSFSILTVSVIAVALVLTFGISLVVVLLKRKVISFRT